jgi:4-carboxymuconolactone decarboxylase
MVPLGAHYQGHSSLSKAEVEIATNLTNARWLAAYSNYEHEMIAEEDGGLPPEKVQALIAGLPTSFEKPREQVVYEITSALIVPRVDRVARRVRLGTRTFSSTPCGNLSRG